MKSAGGQFSHCFAAVTENTEITDLANSGLTGVVALFNHGDGTGGQVTELKAHHSLILTPKSHMYLRAHQQFQKM